MDLKQICKWPFEEYAEKSKVRWKVGVREPVVNGERLLVVDFLKNKKCETHREENSFRVVCFKKSNLVYGITAEGKLSKKVLDFAYTVKWDYPQISEREEKRLKAFFRAEHTNNHQLDNLYHWVEKTNQNMKIQERKKRGELMDEDYRLCPEALPEGLEDYIRREILPQDQVLVYKKGNVRGTCFCCGRQVRARGQRFLQHIHVQCPVCGKMVLCVLETSNAYSADYVGNVVAVQKGTDGETVFFRQWQIQRDMSAQWNDLPRYLNETARYAIRGKKTAKWQREGKDNWFGWSQRYSLKGWTRWYDNRIYDGTYYFYNGGIEEALAGTPMQYADLQGYQEDEHRYKNSIYFLEYHAKYPVIEFLWKAGYRNIVHGKIFGATKENREAIYWQRKKLQDCFKFPLRLLKTRKPEEWTLESVHKVNEIWEHYRGKLSEHLLAAYIKTGLLPKDIAVPMKYAQEAKILKYIGKQAVQRREKAGINSYMANEEIVARDYRDYINECEQLHLDLKDKMILYPKDLQEAHRRTTAQVRFEKNKADQEEFRKVVEDLEQFAWQKGNLFIRPAREQEELRDEGTALHHCVAGYIQRMAKGETAIFFIRKAEEPDAPFYTLELQNKKVIQCRTKDNKSYELSEDVKSFVDMWMEKVVKKGGVKKRKKSKEAAA